jgi:hypothetical protein
VIDCDQFVGWAKTPDANASVGVPTIQPCIWKKWWARRKGAFAHPTTEAVIPGRASSREPGIQNSARRWIPGLRPRGRIPE